MRKIHKFTNGVIYFVFSTAYVIAAFLLSLFILIGAKNTLITQGGAIIVIVSGVLSLGTEIVRIKFAE